MSSFITAVKEGPVKVKFSHILTGIELCKNVTLAPGLIPHGITIGVSANSNSARMGPRPPQVDGHRNLNNYILDLICISQLKM